MRKRLRKKLRLSEFTEYSYEFELELKQDCGDEMILLDDIISAVEDMGLYIGGSSTCFILIGPPHKTVTYHEAELLKDYLQKDIRIASVIMLGPENAWYERAGQARVTPKNYKSFIER